MENLGYAGTPINIKTNTGMPSSVTVREPLTPCGMRLTLRAITLE